MKYKLCAVALSLVMAQAYAGKIDFKAGEGLAYEGITVKLKSSDLKSKSSSGSITSFLSAYGLQAKSLFYPTESTNRLLKVPDPIAIKNGLDRYIHINLPDAAKNDINYINTLMGKLAKESSVEIVYPDSAPAKMALQASTIPDYTDQQYYLKSPDDKKPGYTLGGLNIVAGDNFEGGRGEGVSIISMEIAPWFADNTNLPENAYPDASALKQDGKQAGDHDTASIGIMVAKNLGYGVVGEAYKAQKITYVRNSSELITILPEFKKGDVIQVGMATLIPKGAANCTVKRGCGVPMEYRMAYYDAFKTATDKGIYVIEGAGNDSINLDDIYFEGKFSRILRDPGTILVGAVCGEDGKKADFSSYGSAIDLSAWGCSDIASTGYGDLYDDVTNTYTAKYSGTSAANPQIAGLVANLSGIAAKDLKSLSPVTMRNLLKRTGKKIRGIQNVGYYPNLLPAANYIKNFGN